MVLCPFFPFILPLSCPYFLSHYLKPVDTVELSSLFLYMYYPPFSFLLPYSCSPPPSFLLGPVGACLHLLLRHGVFLGGVVQFVTLDCLVIYFVVAQLLHPTTDLPTTPLRFLHTFVAFAIFVVVSDEPTVQGSDNLSTCYEGVLCRKYSMEENGFSFSVHFINLFPDMFWLLRQNKMTHIFSSYMFEV